MKVELKSNVIVDESKDMDVEVETITEAELLDGSAGVEWLDPAVREERVTNGRARLFSAEKGPTLPEAKFSGRPWTLKTELPLPSVEELDRMERESRSRRREAPFGPHATKWLEEVRMWVWHLVLYCRGTQRKGGGSRSDHFKHWVEVLCVLPRKQRERVLKMIREGVDLPWGREKPDSLRDPVTGGCPENVNLKAEKEKVWETLYEQLREEAVLPWDCKGRNDVDVLPKGMFPIFWTVKANSTKVRIVIDMRRLNEFLCK